MYKTTSHDTIGTVKWHTQTPKLHTHYSLVVMAPEDLADILRSPNHLCYCVCFFTLFVTYFVHNVSAIVSYDRKDLLDIRTAITHPILSDTKDLLQTPDKALISVIRRRKRQRYLGRRSGCPVSI